MYKKAQPFFLICETPLHAGSGSDLGVVDLPIQRERHTGYPKIESSSLKGSIRKAFTQKGTDDKSMSLVFGPEQGDLHAGALGFTDARILLFPVKSMKGVFAWISCPGVLRQFAKDFKLAEINSIPAIPEESTVPAQSGLIIKENQIALEEYTFGVRKDDRCAKLAEWLAEQLFSKDENLAYWKEKLKKDLVVLRDEEFRDFVELSTEVITRTRIDSTTGTVAKGALFTEEYLAADTVMYSLALSSPIFSKDKGSFTNNSPKTEEEQVMDFFTREVPEVIQLGANATIGKGVTRVVVLARGDNHDHNK